MRPIIPILCGGAVIAALTACGGNGSSGLEHVALEPDLVHGGHHAEIAEVGNAWTLDVTAANEGGIDAREFRVEATVAGGRLSLGHATFQGLRASDAAVIHLRMSPIHAIPGIYHGHITIDADDDIREDDETNNVEAFDVIVVENAPEDDDPIPFDG